MRDRWPDASIDLARDAVGSGQAISGLIHGEPSGLPVTMHPHLYGGLKTRLNGLKAAQAVEAVARGPRAVRPGVIALTRLRAAKGVSNVEPATAPTPHLACASFRTAAAVSVMASSSAS